MSDDVAGTLARWAERDAAIGLDAELTEAHLALATRDAEIVDLRERNQRLAQHVAQLVTERDALARQITALRREPTWQRLRRRARSVGGRLVRKGS